MEPGTKKSKYPKISRVSKNWFLEAEKDSHNFSIVKKLINKKKQKRAYVTSSITETIVADIGIGTPETGTGILFLERILGLEYSALESDTWYPDTRKVK